MGLRICKMYFMDKIIRNPILQLFKFVDIIKKTIKVQFFKINYFSMHIINYSKVILVKLISEDNEN